jgi:hypothetical protein
VSTRHQAALWRHVGARRGYPAAIAGSVVVLLGALLLLVSCGAGATSAEASGHSSSSSVAPTTSTAPSPSSTPPGGTATAADSGHYTNSDYNFSFDYPSAWQIDTDVTKQAAAGSAAIFSVGAFNPHGTIVENTQIDGAAVSVYKLKQAVDASTLSQLRTEIEEGVSQLEQAQNAKTLQPLKEATINGLQGFTITYSFAFKDTPAVSALYLLFKGDIEYQVTLRSAEELWQKLEPQMNMVINSFRTTG